MEQTSIGMVWGLLEGNARGISGILCLVGGLPEGKRRRSQGIPCLVGGLPSLPRLCDADATSANCDVWRRSDRGHREKEEEEEKRKR